MYRHPLSLLPTLLAALFLTSCGDKVDIDPSISPAAKPVSISAISVGLIPAGSPQTRAKVEDGFPAEGTTMSVRMTDAEGGLTLQEADYTYTAKNGWVADGAPLLWPADDSPYDLHFQAVSPAGSWQVSLPSQWIPAELERAEALRIGSAQSRPTDDPICIRLVHALAKVQVYSPGQPAYLTDAPAEGALSISFPTDVRTILMCLHSADVRSNEGYVLPTEQGFGLLTDRVYDVALPGGTLPAGTLLYIDASGSASPSAGEHPLQIP